MQLLTIDRVPGREIERALGLVTESYYIPAMMRSTSILMTQNGWNPALSGLQKKAQALGADAVIGIRFVSTFVANESNAVLTAYGTAVKLR